MKLIVEKKIEDIYRSHDLFFVYKDKVKWVDTEKHETKTMKNLHEIRNYFGLDMNEWDGMIYPINPSELKQLKSQDSNLKNVYIASH